MCTFAKADSDCRFQVSGGDPLLTDDRQIERRIEKLQREGEGGARPHRIGQRFDEPRGRVDLRSARATVKSPL